MSDHYKALTQTAGLLIGVGFLGFAVASIDISASTSDDSDEKTEIAPAAPTMPEQPSFAEPILPPVTPAEPAAAERKTLAQSGWAPRSVTPLNPVVDRAAVQAKVEAFRAAMVAADVETLSKLADEHLSFGHSNGTIQTKEDFLAMISTGTEVFDSIELTGRTLITNDDVAMERHTFNSDILIDGEMVTVSLGILEIWQKRGTEWVLVARQAFKS